MDIDSFIVYIKQYIYIDISKDVETGFDTSTYVLDRALSWGKDKKGIGLMKDKLGGKLMSEFASLWGKIYCYVPDDDDDENKKAKNTNKNVS